jgi:TPR repeat protein
LTKREIQKERENNGETLFNIGIDYRIDKKDDIQAFAWLYKAALEDHRHGQYQVGYMYADHRNMVYK